VRMQVQTLMLPKLILQNWLNRLKKVAIVLLKYLMLMKQHCSGRKCQPVRF
jgi:hypothetical protein